MSRSALLSWVMVVGLLGARVWAEDAEQPAAVKAGLTQKVLKGWMEKQYTDMGQYATKSETLEFTSVRYGQPREGHALSDGVPDNIKTTVYPVKMSILHTITYTNENVVKKQTIDCAIVAFKDEFGDWTFRIKESRIEPVK